MEGVDPGYHHRTIVEKTRFIGGMVIPIMMVGIGGLVADIDESQVMAELIVNGGRLPNRFKAMMDCLSPNRLN